MARPMKNLLGRKFNFLTVLKCEGSGPNSQMLWRVYCELCDNERVVGGGNLTRMQSCGCMWRKLAGDKKRTHGMSEHRAYHIFHGMHYRCNNLNNPRYGGRGITVCPEWATFDQFWIDMGPTYASDLSIERVDNDAGYSAANCIWTTMDAQKWNTRHIHQVASPWGVLPLSQAAARAGIKAVTLRWRLKHRPDWPASKTFSSGNLK